MLFRTITSENDPLYREVQSRLLQDSTWEQIQNDLQLDEQTGRDLRNRAIALGHYFPPKFKQDLRTYLNAFNYRMGTEVLDYVLQRFDEDYRAYPTKINRRMLTEQALNMLDGNRAF